MCVLNGTCVRFPIINEVRLLTLDSGTSLSIAKIRVTYVFLRSTEPMWDAIDLSTCSIKEVCVGIIIANIPPLRSSILGLLSRIVPDGFARIMRESTRSRHGRSYQASTRNASNRSAVSAEPPDNESEQSILELEDGTLPGIIETTEVVVQEEGAMSQQTPSVKQIF